MSSTRDKIIINLNFKAEQYIIFAVILSTPLYAISKDYVDVL